METIKLFEKVIVLREVVSFDRQKKLRTFQHEGNIKS